VRVTTSRRARIILALSVIAITSAGCSDESPTKEQLLLRANEAFTAGQYNNAEKDYRGVLRQSPDDPVALPRLAILYYDQRQLAQAYPLLKQAAELRPDDPEVQIKFGFILLSTAQYAEARDAALRILAKQPGDEQALSLLVDTGRSPDEVAEIRKMIEGLRA